VGILFSSAPFITTVNVRPKLLMAKVVSAGTGDCAFRMRRRAIQVFMSVALLLAAACLTMINLGIIPPRVLTNRVPMTYKSTNETRRIPRSAAAAPPRELARNP
jgi:hypothetical protein